MEDDFKIILPENPLTKDEIQSKNRGMFKQDLHKNGILAKVIIFLKINEPCTLTELTEHMNNYYKIDFSRGNVFYSLKKLVNIGLINICSISYIHTIPDKEREEIHYEILKKYFRFINNIPSNFRKQYTSINYYWLNNKEAINYIKWCCEILGFKYEKYMK